MNDIQKYFSELSSEQLSQFEKLQVLYEQWNEKINVISRKDIGNLYQRHVLHSLALAKIIQFKPGTKILDVGTGGGFPGVPLAIMFPDCQFTLVDSVGKKLKVINAITSELSLTNVSTIHARVEEISGTFDFVVSRAVTKLDVIWGWVKPKISTNNNNSLSNGLLYLKGADISTEIPDNTFVQTWAISLWYSDDFYRDKVVVYLKNKDNKKSRGSA